MGIEVRRGPSLLVTAVPILILLLLLLNAHICRVAVSPPPVGGNSSASGGGGEWLVGDIAEEDEFSMDSEINRRMLGGAIHYSYNANNNRKVSAVSCGQKQGTPQTGCLPPRGKGAGPARNLNCATYNRGCK